MYNFTTQNNYKLGALKPTRLILKFRDKSQVRVLNFAD